MSLDGHEKLQVELSERENPENLGSLEILEAFVDFQVMGRFVAFGDYEVLVGLGVFGDLGMLEVQRSNL